MHSLIGMSTSDELVYRAMLELPDARVADLAAHLSLSRADVRRAMDNLADLALVRQSDRADREVVDPGKAMRDLLARAQADVTERMREVEHAMNAVAALAYRRDDHTRCDGVRRIDSVDAVTTRLADLARDARRDCLSFGFGARQSEQATAGERKLNAFASGRGVRIRNVVPDSLRSDPPTMAHLRWMADIGAQTRTSPTLPMRLIIVDQEIALIPIDPARSARGALEVTIAGLVSGLVTLFETVWKGATPLDEAPPRDDHGLEPRERDLIRLLAEGHTDESAARKLAVSVRSVQRMMGGLVTRLGVNSRFQAGAEAVRRGWIS